MPWAILIVREWEKEESTKEVVTTQQFYEVNIIFTFHKWGNSVSAGEDEGGKIKGVTDEDEGLDH